VRIRTAEDDSQTLVEVDMCTQFFRRFSTSDTRGVSGFHAHDESFEIFDDGPKGVFLAVAPREAYWLVHELRSAKYNSEKSAVPWDCRVSFAYGVRVRVDETRNVCLTGPEGTISFVSDEVDQLIEFVEGAKRAYLQIEPPREQSARMQADGKQFSLRVVGNYYPAGVEGDGDGALASHIWFHSPINCYGSFLSYAYSTHYFELADWLESVAVDGSPREFAIGGSMAAEIVFDVVGESSRRQLRIRTCYIRPEDYDQYPEEDLSLEKWPYIEFPLAEVDLRSLAATIREQVRVFRPAVGADAEADAAPETAGT
jgi:hypothetical protein